MSILSDTNSCKLFGSCLSVSIHVGFTSSSIISTVSIDVGFIYPERSLLCRSMSIPNDTNSYKHVGPCLFMSIRVGFTSSSIISTVSIDVGYISIGQSHIVKKKKTEVHHNFCSLFILFTHCSSNACSGRTFIYLTHII